MHTFHGIEVITKPKVLTKFYGPKLSATQSPSESIPSSSFHSNILLHFDVSTRIFVLIVIFKHISYIYIYTIILENKLWDVNILEF